MGSIPGVVIFFLKKSFIYFSLASGSFIEDKGSNPKIRLFLFKNSTELGFEPLT